MEPKFQSSFIPKKPIIATSGGRINMVHGGSMNLLSLIATVAFVITLVTSGGVFAYKRLLMSQNEEAGKAIASAKTAFQPEILRQLIEANSRIKTSNSLLQKHIVVSNLFTLLEDLTVKKIRFKELIFLNKNGALTLSMKGESQTYNAIAVQKDALKKSEFIINPEFFDFTLNSSGTIDFAFSSTLNPKLVSYKDLIESKSATQ